MLGFSVGWMGLDGRGRALSIGEMKISGMILPTAKMVQYGVDLKRVFRSKLVLGIGDGWLKADGELVCRANDLRVGLIKSDAETATG